MRFSKHAALLDIPHLPTEAFKHCGDRKIKLYAGDPPAPPAAPATTSQTQTAELPEWARPYAKETLAKGQALTDINKNPYQTYGADRIAGFTPMQQQAQQQAQNMQPSAQLGMGTGIAAQAGLGALNTEYQPGQFTNQFQAPQAYQPSQFGMLSAQAPNLQSYQMGPAERVSAQQVGTPLMDAAQTGYQPDLQTFQMGPAERVRTQSFANPYSASQYMSPYMQNVVDVQQREAQRSADIAGTQRAARATQAGAFGGSRQAIENAEAARNLATQKGDIQAAGLQSAYQSAQGQFNAEQQARLQAQMANQQAGLQVGGQNLQSALGVQQLGAQTGLQTSLANLSSAQQANVQNQAAQLQTQGMNAQQAMQAALANQQAGLQVGGQNLQAALGVQQLGAGQNLQAQLANQQAFQQAQTAGEQSRQFGAGQGLQAASLGAQYGQAAQQLGEQSNQFGAGLGMQGLQTGLQAAGQLGQLGQTQYGQQMGINQLQAQYGAQQQAQQQQANDIAYQNFLNQQNYPYKQLGYMSDMIRGMPLGQQSTSAIYQAPPSAIQSAGSLGLGAYGLSQLFKADGGLTKSYAGGGVTSQSNIENILSKLSDAQLAQAKQMALAQRDAAKAEMIDTEMRERAIARNGISGTASNSMVDSILPTQESMARGGIVAFAGGSGPGAIEETEDEGGSKGLTLEELIQGNKGNPAAANQYNALLLSQIKKLQTNDIPAYTADDRKRNIKANYEELQSLAGPSPYGNIKTQIENMGTEGAANLQQQKGLAALAAMQGMVQGNNFIRGLGQAGGAFAQAYAPAIKANQDLKRSMASLNINLADAQRQENLGNARGAIAAEDQARRDRADVLRATTARDKAIADLAASGVRLNMPRKGAGAGAAAPKPNPTIYSIEGILEGLKEEHADDPTWTPAKLKREAVSEYNRQTKTGTAGVEAKQLESWDKELETKKTLSPTKWKKLVKDQFGGDEAAAERDFRQRKINNLPTDMYTFNKDKAGGAPVAARGSAENPIRLD